MLSLLWEALAAGVFFLSLYWIRRQRRIGLENSLRAQRTLDETQQALEQAQHRTQQLVGQLTALNDFKVSPTGRRPWKELSDFAVQTTGLVLGLETVILFLQEPISGETTGVSAKGLAPLQLIDLRVHPGEGVLGRALQEGRMIGSSRTASTDTSGLSTQENFMKPPYLVLPLRGRQQIRGLLVLSGPTQDEFTAEQTRIATLLAKQLETILENIDLDESRQRVYGELVDSLTRALQVKESQPQEHSDHCRLLVQAMAEEMHLPAVLKEQLVYGALLHDIGKIGIDERILLKPGSLTPEEMMVVKKHPEIGYHILRGISFMKGIAPIVLYHQEWVNGQGYPEGLAGEEIPLGARMVGLVDAWDAMTHDQPYRPAMAKNNAIAELRQQAGTQFDPKLVDVFLKVVEKMERAATEPTVKTRRSAVSSTSAPPHG